MQFAKLTSDVFEVARLSHSLFRQRFQPFDFEFGCGYFCFYFFACVAHDVLQPTPKSPKELFKKIRVPFAV